MPGDEKGARTVGVSDMPRTIKGYEWFEQLEGRGVKIEGVSMLGLKKGATRHAAVVVCKSRDQAKDFARRVKDKREGPRAKVLNSDKEVEQFRVDMAKTMGWSTDAPDGDKAITAHSGADIRGDATGYSHGFNPHKRGGSPNRSRSRSRRRSPSRSPARRKRSRSRSRSKRKSPPRKARSPSGSGSVSRSRSRSNQRRRSPSHKRSRRRSRSKSRSRSCS
mmetsp:Transcript_63572/g.138454  ORF Transcript_63572/g.138454 Transcript_63572/m.138454 type:complete len:220 (+) Transcript_63572:41-700(+)